MVSIETKQEILELIEKHKEELGDGMYKDLCDSLIDKRIKDDKDEKIKQLTIVRDKYITKFTEIKLDAKWFVFETALKLFSKAKNGLGNSYRKKVYDMVTDVYDKRLKVWYDKSYNDACCSYVRGSIKYEWFAYPLFKLDIPKQKKNKEIQCMGCGGLIGSGCNCD